MPEQKGLRPLSSERTFPGVSTRGFKGKLRIRAGNTGEVFLSDVRPPVEIDLARRRRLKLRSTR